MKLKRIMAIVLCFAMVLSTMSFSVFAEGTCVAKVGDVECADATEMLSTLNTASGEVIVEIYGKLETRGISINNANIEKLSFVGKTDNAEICVDGAAYIDVRSTQYPIEYTDLTLSHTNGDYGIDGRLQEYFSTYNGGDVTYTECKFPNGVTALGSTTGTTVTFNQCVFNNLTPGKYSLWVDGNGTEVVVNGGEFCGVRGAKLFAENGAAFSTLEVNGATFSDTITEKAAVVLTRGEKVVLENNTFINTTDKVQVDDDYASEIEGKTVIIDDNEYAVDSDNLTLEETTPAVTTVATINGVSYETLELALDAAKDETNIEIELEADATLDITAWQTLAIGSDTTETITINGNSNTLTFNHLNSDWNNVATNNAKLILNDMKITNSGYNDGPWNRHDINFACDVELNNVSSDKALAFKAGAVLDTVTISDANTSDTYAIWIQPNGQTVTITNSTIDMLACSDGRGIKIDNQYRAEGQDDKVTLNVSSTSFKTEEKAAIMVKSEVGADINLFEVDISGVAADTVNAVWNDEDSADYRNLITVTGGTIAQEGAVVPALSGSGTEADPYVINNIDELVKFRDDVNSGNKYEGKVVKLTADIDLTGIEWSPIGGEDVYFAGEFGGQGYTISNLTQTQGARMGLFGLIEKAYIHDFTLENVSFTVDADDARVGALAGNLQYWNVVENVTIDGINVTVNGNDGLIGSVTGYAWKSQLDNVDVKNAVYTVNGNGNVIGGHTAYGRAHVWDTDVAVNNAHWLEGTVQMIDNTDDGVDNPVEYVLQNYFVNCDVDGIKIALEGTDSEVGGFFGSDSYNSHSNYFVSCHVTSIDVTAAEGTSQIVGGFIAWNNGTTSAGTVKGFDGCSAAGTIAGANGIYGGFAGQVGGRVCEYYNASADVNITSTGTAGGFVGTTETYSNTYTYNFTDCSAMGDVSGTVAGGFAGKNGTKSVFVEFNNCSANGKVFATSIAGGFIGEVNNGTAKYAIGDLTLVGNTASENVNGDNTVGSLIGYFDGVAKEGYTVKLTLNSNTPDGSDINSGTGHHINISDDTITEDIVLPVAQIGNENYPSLQAAIDAANGATVTLIADTTEYITIADDATVVIDLGGKTLNGYIAPCKPTSLTIKNGSIVNTDGGYSAIEINSGKLTLEDVNIESARHGVRIDGAVDAVINGGVYKLNATSGTRHAVNVSGAANVTIKDGTFIGPKGTSMDSGSAVCVQSGANVTIEGGNFSGGKNSTLGVSGTMSITGGTFDQDPSAYVANGYKSFKNEDETYTVRSIKSDAYTVTAEASATKVRYNNGNPDSFTVKYVATGGNVIGAMAQLEYDTELFVCDEDPNATGRIRMNNNNLTTTNGETVIKELHFKVKKNVEVDTTYEFIAKYVQVVSDFDAAGSGAQDGFVENVIGADVTIIAQYDVTLPVDGSLEGNTYVDQNADYSATIKDFDENKIYTISYTMGNGEEQTIKVDKDSAVNNGFVIEDVTGNLVFTSVTSELNFELILLPEALTGYTLVLVKDGVSAGYTYNGAPMYAIDRYVGLTELVENDSREDFVGGDILGATSVRAILIKGGTTLEEARAAIEVATTASESLEENFDVNRNGQFFFNDAMTAHGCYKEQYELAAKMNWYLSTDVNTDFVLDTDDYDDTVEAFWANLD